MNFAPYTFTYDDFQSKDYGIRFAYFDTSEHTVLGGGYTYTNFYSKTGHRNIPISALQTEDNIVSFEIEMMAENGLSDEEEAIVYDKLFNNLSFKKLIVNNQESETQPIYYMNCLFTDPERINAIMDGRVATVGYKCNLTLDSAWMWADKIIEIQGEDEIRLQDVGLDYLQDEPYCLFNRYDIEGAFDESDVGKVVKFTFSDGTTFHSEPIFKNEHGHIVVKHSAQDDDIMGTPTSFPALYLKDNILYYYPAIRSDDVYLATASIKTPRQDSYEINVKTQIKDYTYPILTIGVGSTGGTVSIVNNSDDDYTISFESLSPVTEIVMTPDYCKIDYTGTGSIWSKFYDKHFLRLIPGNNTISISGDVESLKIEYKEAHIL